MTKDLGTRAIIFSSTFFVGQELAKSLLKKNCQVFSPEDFSKISPEIVRELASFEGFSFEGLNVSSEKFFKNITERFSKVDYVFHLEGFRLATKKEKFSKNDLEKFIGGVENFLKISSYYRSRFLLLLPYDFLEENPSLKDYLGGANSFTVRNFQDAQKAVCFLVATYFDQENVNARVVKTCEILGPGMSVRQKGIAAEILKEFAGGGPIKIPGQGEEVIYPLFIQDLVSGLSRAMFAPSTKGEVFTLLGEGVSVLDFADKARKVFSRKTEIEFVAPLPNQVLPKSEPGLRNPPSGWRPRASFEEGISATIDWLVKQTKMLPVAKKEPEEEEPKEKAPKPSLKRHRPWKKYLTATFLTCLILFFPFAFLGVNLWFSYFNLSRAATAFSGGSFEEVVERSGAASKALSRSKFLVEASSPLFKVLGFEEALSQVEKNIFLAQMIAQTAAKGGYVAQKSGELFQQVILAQEVDLDSSLSEIKLSLKSFLESASLTQSLLSQIPSEAPLLGEKVVILRAKLPLLRQMGEEALDSIDIVPEVLGASRRRTYLILFQNNMEIRPTGGFIGSFGLVTFEKGRLLDFEIQDVYAADGQLRGHVDPPEKLGEFLGLSGWYLRDSNWDPNFPTSAVRAEWFLEKEIGRSVDGVIAVNLFTLAKILEKTGEIYLSDYDEKIDSKNFFEKAQYHIEAGFFPGSTGKKDFLGAAASTLFEELKGQDQRLAARMATSLYTSLEEKDIIIFLQIPQAAKTVSRLGWDGAIREVSCQKVWPEACFADFLMLVEANVGVNKANYWVRREVSHKIKVSEEGKVKKEIVIDYSNESPNDIFPAGRYKNYLRVYVPKGSLLGKVKISGGEEEEQPEVDKLDEHQKTYFGFLVEVPVGEKRQVKIDYFLPEEKPLSGGNYIFLWQKQSGAYPDPISVSLFLPEGLGLVKSTPVFTLTKEGELGYNNTLSKDRVFQFNLREK